MGNCSLKGAAAAKDPNNSVKIMTTSGVLLEFGGPKSVREILGDFPGCAIFGQCGGRLSSPLLDHQQLHGGQFYYLLPQHSEEEDGGQLNVKKSENARMEAINSLKNGSSAVEVLPQSQKGVWKVKLVIDTKHLEEILSEEVNTEALIEQMRVAATSAASATPKRTKMGRRHWGW